MWRGCGKGSGSGAGKRSPVVAGPFRPPSDGSAYRNTNLWEPMTWLQYCGFKTSCPFKYKEYDLYKSIISYLTKESFAHLWSWRFVFRWVRLVVRHLGAPLWMEWFFWSNLFLETRLGFQQQWLAHFYPPCLRELFPRGSPWWKLSTFLRQDKV